MSEVYDLIILGAGPAGISAALYAARAGLHTLWLDKQFAPGGQIISTYEVDNYPGMPGISGMDLGEAMAAHAKKLGISPVRENVLSVEEEAGEKIVRTKKIRTGQRPFSLPAVLPTGNLVFRERKNWEAWEYPIVPPVTVLFSKTGRRWLSAEEIQQ